MDRNSLTILAVLALSVSNLFVGITTENKLLILASAAISASLAILYIVRELTGSGNKPPRARDGSGTAARHGVRPAPFPLWVFGAILFIALPSLLVFLQFMNR